MEPWQTQRAIHSLTPVAAVGAFTERYQWLKGLTLDAVQRQWGHIAIIGRISPPPGHPTMKSLRLLLSALLLVSAAFAESARVPVIKYGLEAITNLEQLPLLFPNGTRTRQPLAYDASGGNYDHHFLAAFAQNIETVKQPDGSEVKEYVIFDEYGPGVLYRQQMNAWIDGSAHPDMWVPRGRLDQPRALGSIRYYFDDEPEPRIDQNLGDFFAARTPPYTEPLAFMDPAKIFAISYYPFAYQKRLKVTVRAHAPTFVTMDSKWYQYTSLALPADATAATWAGPAADTTAVRQLWARTGENPHDPTGTTKFSSAHTLAPGETKTILALDQPGSIIGLKLTLRPYRPETFFGTRLRIHWDGETQPAVDLPLGYFFGGGAKDFPETAAKIIGQSLTTLLFGFNAESGTLYAWWPMPFWKSARITLENASGVALEQVGCEAVFRPAAVLAYPREHTGYFHARRTVDGDPDGLGYRGVAFAEQGRGHVVGRTFYADKYDMDGDEFTYFDGSRTPQVHGSGTEDDHNQGWAGRQHQQPLWGALINGYNGAYRIYLNDCYIFNRDILITYEYSLMKKEKLPRGGTTDVTTFYYKAAAGPNLVLTDELDVGNHFSERQHQYAVTQQTWQGFRQDDYDGYERRRDYGRHTDDGRAFKGASRFTVAVDPANNGVRLRKRINRLGNGVQTASVLVDGTPVGRPWHIVTLAQSPAEHPLDGWFDSEFEIPASHTRGKDRIEVEIRYVASPQKGEINEFHWWVYSYR